MNRTWSGTMIASLAGLFADTAAAGWISGGGEILGPRFNPWFLSPKTEVHYCIRLDEAHVSLDRAHVAARLSEVFDYWRQEFSTAANPSVAGTEIALATQKFIEVSCAATIEQDLDNPDLDIAIQIGVLSSQQRAYLEDPTNFIAASVLTDYSLSKLQGKGFIYVSADSGDLRYKKSALVNNAWAINDGVLLRNVLAHEFGHVFGLTHKDIALISNLMSAAYPEFILTPGTVPLVTSLPLMPVIAPRFYSGMANNKPLCGPLAVAALSFFEMAPRPCFRMSVDGDQMHISGYEREDIEPRETKTATLYPQSEERQSEWGRLGVTPQQTVFNNLPEIAYTLGYLPGPKMRTISKKGFIDLPRAGRRELAITIDASGLQVGAVVNGIFQANIINPSWP